MTRTTDAKHQPPAPPSVVVTGAGGHLGSHLVPALAQAGYVVRGLDVVDPPAAWPAGCCFVRADLLCLEEVRAAVQGAALVVHCASIHPWKPYTDEQYLDVNVKGTWQLYTAVAAEGIERVVLTSSIAAAGYPGLAASPLREDDEFAVTDLYSLTKRTQEDIARLHAARGQVRTVALRPPTFVPLPPLETGFRLTGAFAVVEDMVTAHVAAVEAMLGRPGPDAPSLAAFEAIYTANALPYRAEDAALLGPGDDLRPLVRKHWPEAHDWLIARGYQGSWLPGVYDLSKARRLLGWQPALNFEQWFAEARSTG